MDFLSLSTALHSCQNNLSEKVQRTFLRRQLPSVKGVGQGRAAGEPGQAPGCFLPDMLVVSAEGLVNVEQEYKVLGLLQMGLLAYMLKQLRGQQLRLVVI